MDILLELPMPPTVNVCYRTVRGILILSAKGREFKDEVLSYCETAEVKDLNLTARLEFRAKFHHNKNIKYDIDNRAKPLLDALEEANVFANDNQIDRLILERGCKRQEAMCYVQIKEIADGL